MRSPSVVLVSVLPLLVVSCANKDTVSSSPQAAEGARVRSFDSWATDMGKGGYRQDEDGRWVPQEGSKRSSFERVNRDSPYFKNQFAGKNKEFRSDEFKRKSWWGNKEYKPKSYAGPTDGSQFKTVAELGERSARDSRMVARDATRAAREGGGNSYTTSSAREAGGREIERLSDAETDVRRRVFASPIRNAVDWSAQRQLSVEETKSILGK